MDLMHQIITKAKDKRKRIILSEGTEERTLHAADRAIADKIANIILLGNKAEIKALATKHNLRNVLQAEIIDPIRNEKKDTYAFLLAELRKNKGITIAEAQKLVENPLYLGCLMIKN